MSYKFVILLLKMDLSYKVSLMDNAKNLWNHPDFPKFYYNAAAIKQQEELFKRKFKKLTKLATKSTPEVAFEMGLNSAITEAYHSSGIEGISLDSESMYESLVKNTVPKSNEGSMLKMFTLAMDQSDKPLTHQFIQQLNKTLLPENEDSGKYVGDMKIIESRYIGNEKVVHQGVRKEKVNEAMQSFLDAYNSADPKTPLANAIREHMHFETIHPFCDGNGRVGRALMIMGLCRDLKSKIPLAISKTFQKNQKDYYKQFENRKAENPLDLTNPIKLITPLLIESLKESQKVLELSVIRKKTYDSGLNERQLKVVNKLINYELAEGFEGGLSNENYRKIAKCEPKTAQRDLKQLEKKGILVKSGRLKGTRHHLTVAKTREDEGR